MPVISVRDNIIESLIYQLGLIKTESGYNYTVRNIYDPPINLDAITEYPAIVIMEGPEDCANSSTGSHLQTGGNEALLHNSFTVTMNCIISDINNIRAARSKMLADVQKRIGNNWNIPDALGVPSCFSSFYKGSTPWAVDAQKPYAGIEIDWIIWYRQLLTDPTTSG